MFSQKLKLLRKRDELSQIRFAIDIGFSQAAVSAWENGTREPGIEALVQIAKFFNVTVDYLVSDGTPVKDNTPALSPDEKKLLDDYRALNTKNRMHVSAYASIRREEQEDGALKRG